MIDYLRMRVFLCTDHDSIIRKLVWLNESPSGVFAGMFDSTADIHCSYHTDGTHQTKFIRDSAESLLSREQHPPIASIQTHQQIIGYGAFYDEKTMNRLPIFKSESQETAFVIIGNAIFKHIQALAMNTYIVHRQYQPEFLNEMYRDYQNPPFDLVSVNTFRLENFPLHNVSVVLYRAKPPR